MELWYFKLNTPYIIAFLGSLLLFGNFCIVLSYISLALFEKLIGSLIFAYNMCVWIRRAGIFLAEHPVCYQKQIKMQLKTLLNEMS